MQWEDAPTGNGQGQGGLRQQLPPVPAVEGVGHLTATTFYLQARLTLGED